MTLDEAKEKLWNRSWFGIMMLAASDADALIEGTYSAANKSASVAADIIGIREGFGHFATMHIVNTARGTFFLADTSINPVATAALLWT